MKSIRLAAFFLLTAVLAAGCGSSAQPTSGSRPSAASGSAAGPKDVTIAMLWVLPAFWDNLGARGGVVPGAGDFKGLASAGLIVLDENGALKPQLGESVPSV